MTCSHRYVSDLIVSFTQIPRFGGGILTSYIDTSSFYGNIKSRVWNGIPDITKTLAGIFTQGFFIRRIYVCASRSDDHLVPLISSYSVSGKKIAIPTVWERILSISDKPLTHTV